MLIARKTKSLGDLGILQVGFNVFVDDTVVLINPKKIAFGDYVRIDGFCIISAGEEGIRFGNHVHIAAGTYIYGTGGGVHFEDFSSTQSRAVITTLTDDLSGEWMTNPTISDRFRRATNGPITICRHAVVGLGASVMPNVRVGFGAAISPYSQVTQNVADHQIVQGVPAKMVGLRKKNLVELGAEYIR